MNARVHVPTCVAALVLAVICLSGVARAHDLAAYFRASQEFEALFAQAAKDGRVPRLADRNVADLIRTLSDSKRYLDATTYEVNDLPLLRDVCEKATAVVMPYVLFGLENTIDRTFEPTHMTGQVAERIGRNMVRFQDELQHLQPFVIRCQAKQIPLLGDFFLALPPAQLTDVQRRGLQMARQGAFATYRGFLRSADNPALTERYRDAVLDAIAKTAPQYASFLPLPARGQLADMAASMRPLVEGRLRGHIEQILRAMKETRCEGLCKF